MKVFISACQADWLRVEPWARFLRKEGYSVLWWDDTIAPGRSLWEGIRANLEKASCVVAFFSGRSLESKSVLAEAEAAWNRGILVTVLLEPVRVLEPFGMLRHVEYFGEGSDLGRARSLLLEGVREKAGRPPRRRAQAEPKSLAHLEDRAVITEEDCDILWGREYEIFDGSPWSRLLVGRTLADDVYPPNSPDAMPLAGTTVRATDLRRFLRLGVGSVHVRNLVQCSTEFGVCARCFGKLPNGRLPRLGSRFGNETFRVLDRRSKSGRLDDLLRGRVSADRARLSELDGTVRVAAKSVTVTAESGDRQRVRIPKGRRSVVKTGDVVRAGDPLTSGVPSAQDVLRILGARAASELLVDQLGTAVKLEHGLQAVEFVVREMMQWVQILDAGDLGFRDADVVPKAAVTALNSSLAAWNRAASNARSPEYARPAIWEPLILDPRR